MVGRVATREISCAASSLVDALFDRAGCPVTEVARTAVSVHFETGCAAVPVLCLCTPGAIYLPNSVVTAELPPPGQALVGDGAFRSRDTRWLPRRWWSPPRPRDLVRPDDLGALNAVTERMRFPGVRLPRPSYDGLDATRLVGAGPGLTPAGDDVLAGALVTAHATGDPRLAEWRRATRSALSARSTTAVSWAMLHHAMDGYATSELAGFLVALCQDQDLDRPLSRLLAVGHTSGAALLTGIVHTLTTHEMQALTTHEMRGTA